jgi:MFS family permease
MTRLIFGASVGWLGISMIADGVPALLLPYRLGRDGATDATTLGLVTLVAIGLAALVQPIAGRWSDAIGRFPVVAVGVVTAGVGFGLLVVPGSTALPLIGTVVVLVGASIAQAGQQALLPDYVKSEDRGLGAGAKGAFDVGGAFVGFLVLAALIGAGALTEAAVVLMASLAGALLLGYLVLPARRRGRGDTPRRRIGAVSEILSLDTAERGPLVRLIVARFLFLLGIYVVGRFLFMYVGSRFALDPEATGQLAGGVLAALALITVIASVPGGWLSDRIGRRPVMLIGGVVAAGGVALLPLAGSTALLLVTGALIAIGSAGFGAGSWALLTDLTARAETGRLLGLAHFGTAGAAAAAGAFGLIVDAGERFAPTTGYALAFGLAAVCALAGGLMAWRLTLPTHPSAEENRTVEART